MASVAVLGAGGFGKALAKRFRNAHDTMLWARSAESFHDLPGDFPPFIELKSGEFPDLELYSMIIVATDSSGVPDVVGRIIEQRLDWKVPVLFTQKGLVNGVSPTYFATKRGLSSGLFTGAAFADDIYAGSPALMLVASDEDWICDLAMDIVEPLDIWLAKSSNPDVISAANVARTISSIEMGMLLGYAEQNDSFRATLLAAAVASIEREGRALTRVLAKQSFAEDDRVISVLDADQKLCSGLLRKTSKSRNWRLGNMLARGFSLDIALSALRMSGVVQGVANIKDILTQYPTGLPFLNSANRVLDGESTVAEEVENILSRRGGWFK